MVAAGFQDVNIFEVGANLIWSPVRNLDIGVEAIYRKLDPKNRERFEFGDPLTTLGTGNRPDPAFFNRDTQDAWEARLRIERGF